MKTFASYLVAISLVGSIKAKNDCVLEEKTWSIEGQLEFLQQVTLQECLAAFLESQDGQALSYFGNYKYRFDKVCIIFGNLDGERSCTNCISIKGDYTNNNCRCNQLEGECQIEEDNFLQALLAKSEFECWLQCSINDHCNYYTWFSPENEDVSDECLLFSSCQTINECNGGCYVGQVDCYEPTTMTTDTTTTPTITTTLPELCNENTYLTLDEPTRNMNYGQDDVRYCDYSGYGTTSPDWQGPNWYRMIGPAGSKIPETYVDPKHCNTGAPGWLNGTHPTIQYETVDRTVCFYSIGGNKCHWETAIQIRNCGDYFLYYLPEPPTCYLRYCSE